MMMRTLTAALLLLTALSCGRNGPPGKAVAEESGQQVSSGEDFQPMGSAPKTSTALGAPVFDWAGDFNNIFSEGETYFAGVPTEAGYAKAKAAGVRTVITLFSDEETSKRVKFDEAAALKKLDLNYVQIPMSMENFDGALIDRFAKAYDEANGSCLIHCASSNRVGALWAAYLGTKKNVAPAEALKRGKAVGLKRPKLLAKVGEILEL